ncbi:hypothetical protein [Microbacterium aurantiacum]|uniref:hypothetical protein n=1 Tax=Microbacterium aurantiacum TaxID=162393 RepID=UPI0015E08949|nr:hypothetical protein [Microbacterium aurantiacum]
MNSRPYLPIVAVLALMLAGCSNSSATPSSGETATATDTPESSTVTLEELQTKYVDAGGDCDRMTVRADSAVSEEAGDCDGGALLTTYRSDAQRDSAILVLKGLQDSNPSPHVIAVGPDWIVNGADAGSFAAAMGGEPLQIGTPR